FERVRGVLVAGTVLGQLICRAPGARGVERLIGVLLGESRQGLRRGNNARAIVLGRERSKAPIEQNWDFVRRLSDGKVEIGNGLIDFSADRQALLIVLPEASIVRMLQRSRFVQPFVNLSGSGVGGRRGVEVVPSLFRFADQSHRPSEKSLSHQVVRFGGEPLLM